ncbi:hypothetical protein [Priestia megaterium]|uniref:hypothetical protein n=1 Tax=Priestia megaterium TaxID=1404 RepID=UPI0013638A4C|nr:hypothetical protein [Priestia megaterium]
MPINIQPILNLMQSILQSVGQVSSLLPPSIIPPSLLPPSFISPPIADGILYTEIAIPVPQPPGVTGLPPNVYFDVSNLFTAAQKQKIRDSISGVLFNWSLHMTQKWNGGMNNGVSQMAACSNTYATRNLRPIWYQGVAITNGRKATEVAMDQFTQMIKDNGFRKSPPSRIDWIYIPSIPFIITTMKASTAFTQAKVPINILVNAYQLDQPTVAVGVLIGSMMHAWLHRAGFSDPKTTSYFISECPMCTMRGYGPKSPAIPDSLYYQYFD